MTSGPLVGPTFRSGDDIDAAPCIASVVTGEITMKPHIASLALISLVLAGAPLLHARDKHARLDSRWRESTVTVDGSPADWPGPLQPFNDQPVSMAAVNDGESLFVVLTASDRVARTEILRQGLIVWFDASGKDKKRFGLKFPIGTGLSEGDFHGRRRGGGADPSSGSGEREGPPPASGAPHDAPIEPPNRLEILGASKDDARSFTADKAPGIEVKVGQAEGLLTYELKVPLASNDAHPYAIGAQPGALISVGLEMPKLEMPEGGRREGGGGGRGGPGGGGIGGFGGGMGGHGGGGMGGRHGGGGGDHTQSEQAKPLSGWVALQLAAK
jgi:hypothetical protein